MRSRCASSSLPCSSNHASRSASSASIPSIACCMRSVGGDVVRRREQHEPVELLDDLAGERVDRRDALDLVAEQLEPHGALLVGRDTPRWCRPAPGTCCGRTRSRCARTAARRAGARIDRWSRSSPTSRIEALPVVLVGCAEPVDRRHRRDDDHVAPAHDRAGGRVAEPVDLVVDRRVLLDVGVGGREVRLGLVVVVVGDEVLDPVLREQLAELAGELRGQALVGREHDRGPLHLLDHPGDRERLPRAGDAEQRLEPLAPLDARPRARRSPRAGRRRPSTR